MNFATDRGEVECKEVCVKGYNQKSSSPIRCWKSSEFRPSCNPFREVPMVEVDETVDDCVLLCSNDDKCTHAHFLPPEAVDRYNDDDTNLFNPSDPFNPIQSNALHPYCFLFEDRSDPCTKNIGELVSKKAIMIKCDDFQEAEKECLEFTTHSASREPTG